MDILHLTAPCRNVPVTSTFDLTMRSVAIGVVEYLLGFLALALFAYLAFARGPVSDERFVFAFKVAAPVAVAEIVALFYREQPANRLILGANLWLVAGGAAAVLEQWWWLQGYQQLGEASLFLSILAVGAVATVASPAGFIAVRGARKTVVLLSLALLAGVALALLASVYFRGDVKFAGVLPIVALSWLNRILRRGVPAEA